MDALPSAIDIFIIDKSGATISNREEADSHRSGLVVAKVNYLVYLVLLAGLAGLLWLPSALAPGCDMTDLEGTMWPSRRRRVRALAPSCGSAEPTFSLSSRRCSPLTSLSTCSTPLGRRIRLLDSRRAPADLYLWLGPHSRGMSEENSGATIERNVVPLSRTMARAPGPTPTRGPRWCLRDRHVAARRRADGSQEQNQPGRQQHR